MRFDFKYDLTDEMIDRVTRRFILHQLNGRVAAIVAAYVILLLLLCAMDAGRWICGVFGGAILLLFLLVIIAYVVRGREGRAALRKMPHREIRWEVTDQGLARHSALGTANWPWTFFDALVIKPDFLLFLLRRQFNAFIPTSVLSPEALAFIRERIVAHGGRVIGG